MPKRKIRKTIDQRLISAFDTVFASVFNPTSKQFYLSGCAIEFDLSKFKNILKHHQQLNDNALNKFYSHVSTKFEEVNYSDKSKQVFLSLCQQIDPLIKPYLPKDFTAATRTDVNFTDWIAELGSSLKNTAKAFATSVKKYPFSIRSGFLFGMYALAGQPVAGAVLARRQPSASVIRSSLNSGVGPSAGEILHRIIAGNTSDWPQYYSYMNEVIGELEANLKKSGYLSYAIKEKIFWFFRNYYAAENQLLDEQSNRLYQIIERTLMDPTSELLALEKEHLSILEDIFILAKQLYRYANGNISIFHLYIDAAKNKQNLSTIEKAGTFITQLFDAYQVYLADGLSSATESADLINPIHALINAHLTWNQQDPVAMLANGLDFLNKVREKYKNNRQITSFVDSTVKKISEDAIKKIPITYRDVLCFPEEWVKEEIGVRYVHYLTLPDRASFTGLYKILTVKNIFPHSEIKSIKGINGAADFKVTMHYDELSIDKKNQAFALAVAAYNDIEKLKSRLSLNSKEQGPIVITMHLFNDEYQFNRYGYLLFGFDSSGGGVCTHEEKGLCIANVYQTVAGFLNFKHELVHALTMHFLGKNYRDLVSGTFGEGIADWYDKGSKNVDKINFLNHLFLEGKIKSLSEIVTLDKGGAIVYLWGYFWMKYMLEQSDYSTVRPIFQAIQTGDKAVVRSAIDSYASQNNHSFSKWLQKLNEENYVPPTVTELNNKVQANYLQDLKNNLFLQHLICQNGGEIQFNFVVKPNEYRVFSLSMEKISVSDRTKHSEYSVNIDLNYYNWFKMQLLANSGVPVLAGVDNSRLAINLQQDRVYLAAIIRLVNHRILNPREKCFLADKITRLPLNVQASYLSDLEKNPKLLNFIQSSVFIEFIFNDTVFVLKDVDISRHAVDNAKHSQSISLGDYAWFKTALQVCVIDQMIQSAAKCPLSARERNAIIVKLLNSNRSDDEVANMRSAQLKELAPELREFVMKQFFEQYGVKNAQALESQIVQAVQTIHCLVTEPSHSPQATLVNPLAAVTTISATIANVLTTLTTDANSTSIPAVNDGSEGNKGESTGLWAGVAVGFSLFGLLLAGLTYHIKKRLHTLQSAVTKTPTYIAAPDVSELPDIISETNNPSIARWVFRGEYGFNNSLPQGNSSGGSLSSELIPLTTFFSSSSLPSFQEGHLAESESRMPKLSRS